MKKEQAAMVAWIQTPALVPMDEETVAFVSFFGRYARR